MGLRAIACRLGFHEWRYAGHVKIGREGSETRGNLTILYGWRQIHFQHCRHCDARTEFTPPFFYYEALRQIAEERGLRDGYEPNWKEP